MTIGAPTPPECSYTGRLDGPIVAVPSQLGFPRKGGECTDFVTPRLGAAFASWSRPFDANGPFAAAQLCRHW